MKNLEQNFSDWEKSVFGFGYGSGEPHVIPALRSFLALCTGNGATSYNYEQAERELGAPVAWLIINALCNADAIEYGTSPRFGWLTLKGQALQQFMLARDLDTLITLACGPDEDEYDTCYPDACNCGGYEKGKVCVNPFWQEDAARAALASMRGE